MSGLKRKTIKHMQENEADKSKGKELYQDICEFMKEPDVDQLLLENDKGLFKYFQFYVSLAK